MLVNRFAATLILAVITSFSAITVQADDSGTLPYYGSAEFTPFWLTPDSDELASFHKIPAFSFTNQDGVIVNNATVAGKLYVASFFFSTCPGICPAIKSRLYKVQNKFIDNDNVLILSHSIRPKTDTTEVLQAYAKRNDVKSEKWHLLTGEQEAIYQIAKQSYFASEDLGEQESLENFLHTENLLLIDTQGHIRGIYNGLNNASVSYLIADINILLKL